MNKTWTRREEIILLKNKLLPYKQLKFILKTSYEAISHKMGTMGIGREKDFRWTKEKIEKLKLFYPHSSKRILLKIFSGASWDAIKASANKFGIYKNKPYKIENLLKETACAYYWMGFLLADGCFRQTPKGNYCLSLEISRKDLSHLKKFVDFVESQYAIRSRKRRSKKHMCKTVCVAFMDNKIKEIMRKFDIHNRKTYISPRPQKIFNISDDLLFSLLIGYIDGDGCIRRTQLNGLQIAISCHSNWYNFYKGFENLMFRVCKEKKNRTYAKVRNNMTFLTFSKKSMINTIKTKAKKLKLPLLKRKWDIISDKDINAYYARINTRQKREEAIKKCYQEGGSFSQTTKKLKLNDFSIAVHWRKMKLAETTPIQT